MGGEIDRAVTIKVGDFLNPSVRQFRAQGQTLAGGTSTGILATGVFKSFQAGDDLGAIGRTGKLDRGIG